MNKKSNKKNTFGKKTVPGVLRYWELQRLGILRQLNDFLIVTPSGGCYEMDTLSTRLLLLLHGKLVDSRINGYAPMDVKKFSAFAEKEFLLEKKSQIGSIESHFDIPQVIKNLGNNDMQILTMGDLVLQIDNHCNYQCRGCSVNADLGRITKLAEVDFEQIIRDAARFGCLTLGLTGGEPILPGIIDQLCHLIVSARNHKFKKVVIATNGFYVRRFIRQLKQAGATRLSISFHGFDGYMEEYTGCPYASTKSMEAIRACLLEGLHLGINCVLTKQNLSQIDRIVNVFYPIIQNVFHAYIRFSPLVEVGRANSNYDYLLDQHDVALILEKVGSYKETYGDKIRLTCDEEYDPEDPMICDAGLMYAMVNKEGDVCACDLLESKQSMGNAKRESFFKIWNNNERWSEFRKIIPINLRCSICPTNVSRVCFGRCKALSCLRFNSLTMSVFPERRCLK